MLLLVLQFADGSRQTVGTGPHWQAMDAGAFFDAQGNTGAWARGGGMPQENLDLREEPVGWASAAFQPGPKWGAAAVAPPFFLRLGAKSAAAARPIAVFLRAAAAVRTLQPPPPPPWTAQCGILPEGATAHIGCPGGHAITGIAFAAFGTVTGSCAHGFTRGTCDAEGVEAKVKGACLGKTSCAISVGVGTFGEVPRVAPTAIPPSAFTPRPQPCHRQPKHFAFDINCAKTATTPTYLVDFGRELQGGLNLTFRRGVAGARVIVKLSEELLPDGRVMVPMRTGNNFTAVFTLRDGPQSTVGHEYMEFRYAQIEGSPEPIDVGNAAAWIVRYPLSTEADDQYNDVPVAPSRLQPAVAMAKMNTSNSALNAVWELVRHTLVATALDVNTDSNTRQRDLCHTDAFITGLGQLALTNSTGVVAMTAEDGFQLDSNVWRGTTDFRAALVGLAFQYALYSGDLRLLRQRWPDIKLHSLVDYFDAETGLIVKPAGAMGRSVPCPESWAPPGIPSDVWAELGCTCADLVDWPTSCRDGFVFTNASAVANAYVAFAADKVAEAAGWLGEADDERHFTAVAQTIRTSLRQQLYNASTGTFADGIGTAHTSLHATLFPMMAGAVNDSMGAAVVRQLRARGMRCSCMAAFWLLEGLYRVGWHTADAADYALELLTSSGPRSWLAMIAQGATATMEAWDRGEKPNLTWSHPWCSGPNSVLVRLLLGITPAGLGWSRMQFAPQPSNLTSITAAVPTTRGTVQVAIVQGPNVFEANLTVPPAIPRTRICIPPAHAGAHGAPELTINGLRVDSELVGRMLCATADVPPGRWRLLRRG